MDLKYLFIHTCVVVNDECLLGFHFGFLFEKTILDFLHFGYLRIVDDEILFTCMYYVVFGISVVFSSTRYDFFFLLQKRYEFLCWYGGLIMILYGILAVNDALGNENGSHVNKLNCCDLWVYKL